MKGMCYLILLMLLIHSQVSTLQFHAFHKNNPTIFKILYFSLCIKGYFEARSSFSNDIEVSHNISIYLCWHFKNYQMSFWKLSWLLMRQKASFNDTVMTEISSPDAISPVFFSQYMSGIFSPRESKTSFL